MAEASHRSSHAGSDCPSPAGSQCSSRCSDRFRDGTDWFLRRVGLARSTTFLCAAGLALAAAIGPHLLGAVLILSIALCTVLARMATGAARKSKASSVPTTVVTSILIAGLSMGYLGGSVRLTMLFDGGLPDHVNERVAARVVVTGPVRSSGVPGEGWQSAIARLEAAHLVPGMANESPSEVCLSDGENVLLEVAPGGAGPSARVDAGPILREGLIIDCEGTLREPDGPSSSGFDQRSYLRRQGVEVVLSVDARDLSIEGARGGFWGFFDRVRSSARTDLGRGPSARLDEVLKGVVMGETTGIDDDWLESFRRAGTAHMFSVSGLHVASLAAIMLGLARLTRRSRTTGNVLAALAACFMIPFTGASPPVVRAVAMVMVVLMASWAGRGRDRWQVLALAACVVLVLNPLSLFDVGFQLSFGAFAGMLALSMPLQRRMQRLPTGIASNLSVSMAASLGTAPVCLLVFDRTSLVGVLANLVVVPVLPLITGLGLAGVLLGHVWGGLSTVLDWMVAPVVAWTVQSSRLFAAAPVLETEDIGRALSAIAFTISAAPLAFAFAGRAVRLPLGVRLPLFRRSVKWCYRHRPRSHGLGLVLAVAVLAVALVAGAGAYTPASAVFHSATFAWGAHKWPQEVEIRVLDVGQGNAVLVRTPGGRALLFDGGPAGCDLADQLAALGVRRLDAVIVSHPHADHFAGLLECVDDVRIGVLLDHVLVTASRAERSDSDPASQQTTRFSGSREAEDYLELRRRVQDQGGGYTYADSSSMIEVDGVHVTFFAPRRPLEMVDGADPWGTRSSPPGGEELNGASLVALLRYGESEFLLPGDAEAEVLEGYDLPQADVIVVPHHGSRGACSRELLELLKVNSAAVSVGEDNSFGHPDPSTMDILSSERPIVARTDLAGWICYTTDGTDLVMSTERDGGQ